MAVIRDFGVTTISADKETAEKLRSAAKNAGKSTYEYLKEIVDKETGDEQGTMLSVSKPKTDNATKLTRVMAAALVMAAPVSWIMEMRNPGEIMRLIETGEGELDQLFADAKEKINSAVSSKVQYRLNGSNPMVADIE